MHLAPGTSPSPVLPPPEPPSGPRPALPSSRPGQLLHGFLLHLHVLRALLRTPALRRRYWAITLTQAAVTLALAVPLVPVYRALTEASHALEQRAEAALQGTLGTVEERLALAKEGAPGQAPERQRAELSRALEDVASTLRQERRAHGGADAPDGLARQLEEAERLREEAAEARAQALEEAERLREEAAAARERALAEAEQAREEALEQMEEQLAAHPPGRAPELLASEAALRATARLQEQLAAQGLAVDVAARLAALQARFAAARDKARLPAAARAEVALGVAIEASFLLEAAREERRLLRRAEDVRADEDGDEDALAEAEARLEAARTLRSEARAVAKEALTQVARAEKGLPVAPARVAAAIGELSPAARLLVYLAALYAVLYLVQAVVVVLSRDYHDALSRHAFLALGLTPEDPELRPRVRLDWPWLRTRLWRRWRALKLFVLGTPVVALVSWPLPDAVRPQVRSLLLTLWGAWWFTVFVAARSARAWEREGRARAPWFLRAAGAATSRVPLLGRGPSRFYGWLWRHHGSAVFAPAECVEQQPWAFAGLALFRAVGSLPLLKFFVRPLTPVASAWLLEARRAG